MAVRVYDEGKMKGATQLQVLIGTLMGVFEMGQTSSAVTGNVLFDVFCDTFPDASTCHRHASPPVRARASSSHLALVTRLHLPSKPTKGRGLRTLSAALV